VHSAPAPNRVRHTEKLTNVDILSGVLGSNYWRFTFIPTYLQYLSNLEVDNPWAFSDDEVVGLLQMVWDRLYGVKGLHHRVVIGEAVFAVVSIPRLFNVSYSSSSSRQINTQSSGVTHLLLLHFPFYWTFLMTKRSILIMTGRICRRNISRITFSCIEMSGKMMERYVQPSWHLI
jgi:hypothetical protein